MSVKLNYPFGSGGGGGTGEDPTKLPLAGGIMDGGATVIFPLTNNKDSEIGAWGFGVEQTTGTNAGSYSTVEPNLITAFKPYDGDNTYTTTITGDEIVVGQTGSDSAHITVNGFSGGTGDASWLLNANGLNVTFGDPFTDGDDNEIPNSNSITLTSAGVKFPDGSIQSTSSRDFGSFPIYNSDGQLKYTYILNPNVNGSDDPIYFEQKFLDNNGDWFGLFFSNQDYSQRLEFSSGMKVFQTGITFPDSSVQVTAGLPLTGGTMTGSLNVAGNYNNLSIQVTDNEGPNWARLSQNGTITSHSDGYNDLIINSVSGINLGETVFGETSKTISGTTRLEDSHTGFVLTPDASGYGPRLTFSFGNDGDPYNNLAILSQDGLLIKEEISGNVFANYSASGITFPDSSTQTTAGIPEAPIDGNAYVRKDGAWVDITTL